jgi:hypothetical protein
MARTPRQAVLEHLARAQPPVRAREAALAGIGGRSQSLAASPPAGPPWRPRLETLAFLKEREILDRHVCVVGFEADHVRTGTQPMTMVLRAERVAGLGWVARASSSGGAHEATSTGPRLDLTGSWGSFGFCGGGRVHAFGASVARVRLRFTTGVELDDDARAGWVVFFTDEPVESPDATIELLDPAGDVVATHEWPPRPDLADELRRRIPRG